MSNYLWYTLAVFVAALHFAVFGMWVAGQKGRSLTQGAALGFLYGPFGVIVLALLPDDSVASEPAQGPVVDADLPWLDEFGDARKSVPAEVLWLNDLETRARR